MKLRIVTSDGSEFSFVDDNYPDSHSVREVANELLRGGNSVVLVTARYDSNHRNLGGYTTYINRHQIVSITKA